MQMGTRIKGALLTRRGLPVILTVIVLSGGMAVAQLASVFTVSYQVPYPTHSEITIDLGNVPAGKTRSRSATGFLGLPDTYTITWSLGGNLDKFSSVTVQIDYNNDGIPDVTLTKTSGTGSLLIPAGTYTIRYTVTVTAISGVRTGVSIVSDGGTISVSWSVS